MSDSPFGRQPQRVTVTIEGETPDVEYWTTELMRRAEHKGDTASFYSAEQSNGRMLRKFVIDHRAVND